MIVERQVLLPEGWVQIFRNNVPAQESGNRDGIYTSRPIRQGGPLISQDSRFR